MRFLLADDHGLFREGIKLIFNKLQPNVEVIEAENLEEAHDVLDKDNDFDLILVDLKMPGMKNVTDIADVVAKSSNNPVVIMSGAYKKSDVLSCIDNGASGFIPKTLSSKSMMNAINLVLNGEKYIPSVVFESGNLEQETVGDDFDQQIFKKLTDREREVLGHLMEGHSNKTIASILDLKEVTVRAHLKGVFRKLNVSSRTQAVGIALRSDFKP